MIEKEIDSLNKELLPYSKCIGELDEKIKYIKNVQLKIKNKSIRIGDHFECPELSKEELKSINHLNWFKRIFIVIWVVNSLDQIPNLSKHLKINLSNIRSLKKKVDSEFSIIKKELEENKILKLKYKKDLKNDLRSMENSIRTDLEFSTEENSKNKYQEAVDRMLKEINQGIRNKREEIGRAHV